MTLPKAWQINLYLLAALLLSLLPLPAWVGWLRPDWVLLVLLSASFTMPWRVGVGYAFIMGILLDLCHGTVLGEHAVAFVPMIYLMQKFHQQLKMFPGLQMCILVLFFSLLYKFILSLIQGAVGVPPENSLFWLGAIVNVILWPWFARLIHE